MEVDHRWTVGRLREIVAETLGVGVGVGVATPAAQSVPPTPVSDEVVKATGSNPTIGTGGAVSVGRGGGGGDPLQEMNPVGVPPTPSTPSSSSSSLRLFKNNPKGAELKDDSALISASGFYNNMSIFVAYGKVGLWVGVGLGVGLGVGVGC